MTDYDESFVALEIDNVPIDVHCVGDRWTVNNIDQLAKLVAIVAMGQATYAAHIIKELSPASPAFTNVDLKGEAIIKLTVQEGKQTQRTGYPRWQRDGLIFEIISWIAARQLFGVSAYLKDPHISSTSQGLDGLMIEMVPGQNEIARTTIFEDKCSDNPRDTFSQKVIPAFIDRHKNKRSAELIASAASLIKLSGIDDLSAIRAANRVLDIKYRRYRASLAVTTVFDTDDQRRELFKGYDTLTEIESIQRMGACFVVGDNLRDWFDELSGRAISFLETLEEESINV